MEPIELSGKTFCSNCGLTIGNVSPKDPIAQVTNPFGTSNASFSDITAPAPQPIVVPTSPIKNSAAEELGIPTPVVEEVPVQPSTGAIIDSPADLGAVKVRVNSEENSVSDSVVTATEENSFLNTSNAPLADSHEEQTPMLSQAPEDVEEVDNSAPLLGQILDMPTDQALDTSEIIQIPESNTSADISLENKIKEVDTLGASGILLDILNENFQLEARENDLHALEAAEQLIDKVEIADFDQTTKEENKDIDFGILDDQPQNPVEYPELPSPLDELEIEPPKNNEEPLPAPNSAPLEEISAVDQVNISESKDESIHDDLYKLPHELENLPNPHSKDELKKDIEKVEDSLSHLDNAKIDESIVHSHYYDPDTIAPLETPVPTQPTKVGETQTKVVTPESTLKQEIVTTFFKEKVAKPKAKLPFWKKFTKKKKPKTKKTKTVAPTLAVHEEKVANKKNKTKKAISINFNKKWLLYPLLATLTIIFGLTTYFAYQNYQLPSEQEARTTETTQTSNFESKIPSEVPIGYEMTGSNFDDEQKQLLIRYDFVNDKDKTLIYKQKTISGTPQGALADYVNSRKGESYVSKEQNGLTFTEFTNGTLVWTSDEFLFTIEAQGYDLSHDLLYKMALSLG